jgi:chemotaxis signal transduction protein
MIAMEPAATVDVCAFMVSKHCFAVRSACVIEVLRGEVPTRVPLAPAGVLGVLHLRGQIVPVIDMRCRLGFPTAAPLAPPTHVVIRVDDERYSLLVDEVLGVQSLPAGALEAVGRDDLHDARVGVFAGGGHLVHVLEPQRIVQPLVRPRTSPVIRHGASDVGTSE